MKGFALGLALKQRRKATRKSPIKLINISETVLTITVFHFPLSSLTKTLSETYKDFISLKPPAKRTRKSTQVYKTRTYVRTCDGWPNGFASRLASSSKSQKSRKLHAHTVDLWSTCVDLRWVAKRWNYVRRLAYEFELDQTGNASQRKWVAKRNANWTQVENVRGLRWTCESVWPGLKIILTQTFSRRRSSVCHLLSCLGNEGRKHPVFLWLLP